MKFSALYVRPDGPYPELTDDWYDIARDARTYSGSRPVVAHPPCKRWGRFWYADGSDSPGEDGGLFEHALYEVRRCGGVLEHPEASHAWAKFDLPKPKLGCWIRGLFAGEWSTCVPQCNYGHKARKLTWLLYVGEDPIRLNWSMPEPGTLAYLCPPGRRKGKPGRTDVKRLTPAENELTPRPFAELLARMATGAG